MIFGGDTLDGVVLNDKRFNYQSLSPELYKRGDDYASILDRAIEGFVELAEPAKSKIIGFMEGNHEVVADKTAQTRVTRRLAAALNTYHFGYSLGLGVKLVSYYSNNNSHITRNYVGYLHHGSGGAQTKGGKLNRGINKANDWEGVDFHMRGHLHEPMITPMIRGCFEWGFRSRDLIFTARQFVIIQSGSYLKTRATQKSGTPNSKDYEEPYNAYSEIAEYSPVYLGMRGIQLFHKEYGVVGVEPSHFDR